MTFENMGKYSKIGIKKFWELLLMGFTFKFCLNYDPARKTGR